MVQITGFAAAVIGALAFLPQVLKTWRTRSSSDLSLGMLLASVTAATLWVGYGISIGSGPVVVGNGITLALASTLLYLKVRCDPGGFVRKFW
jgi:MtN3 and saliva related transmembrane protein